MPPPWVPMLMDVTQAISLAGFAFLFLALVGSAFSPQLKKIKRVLLTIGLVLLAVCFVAGAVAGGIGYVVAQQFRDGGL